MLLQTYVYLIVPQGRLAIFLSFAVIYTASYSFDVTYCYTLTVTTTSCP